MADTTCGADRRAFSTVVWIVVVSYDE